MVLKGGQRHPTGAESRRADAELYRKRSYWDHAELPQEPREMPFCPVALFLPRGVSEFLWDEHPEPWNYVESEYSQRGSSGISAGS